METEPIETRHAIGDRRFDISTRPSNYEETGDWYYSITEVSPHETRPGQPEWIDGWDSCEVPYPSPADATAAAIKELHLVIE